VVVYDFSTQVCDSDSGFAPWSFHHEKSAALKNLCFLLSLSADLPGRSPYFGQALGCNPTCFAFGNQQQV